MSRESICNLLLRYFQRNPKQFLIEEIKDQASCCKGKVKNCRKEKKQIGCVHKFQFSLNSKNKNNHQSSPHHPHIPFLNPPPPPGEVFPPHTMYNTTTTSLAQPPPPYILYVHGKYAYIYYVRIFIKKNSFYCLMPSPPPNAVTYCRISSNHLWSSRKITRAPAMGSSDRDSLNPFSLEFQMNSTN